MTAGRSGSGERAAISRRSILAGLASVSISMAAARASGAPAPPEIRGINFSLIDVNREKIAACPKLGRGASIHGLSFLTRYREPAVRENVRRILDEMRKSSITAIRHNFWFINNEPKPRDVFSAQDPQLAIDCLGMFIDDMKAAGQTKLVLSMSPVGQSLPGCRKVHWGDCFQDDTVDTTMRFVTAIARAATDKLGRDLYVDPLNEGIASRAVRPELRHRLAGFLAEGLRTFAALAPRPQLVLSTQANQPGERLVILDRLLQDSGVRIDVLDIHVYRGRSARVDPPSLQQFRDYAVQRKFGLIVGEIQSDVETIRQTRAVLNKGDSGDPMGYFPWPLSDPGTGCHSDMNVLDVLKTLGEVRRQGG